MINGEEYAILPVPRTRREAKQFYDRISPFYDYLTRAFERKYAENVLKRLAISEGEIVLEIGFGAGRCLRRIAERVGQTGKACGIDISSGMIEVTRRRLARAGLMDRCAICCGDAVRLPYRDSAFDAVFMSFTLELFETPEIPKVLDEIGRVLKPACKLGVVSLSREDRRSILLRLYEWAHMKWPRYVDCRPIYVEQAFRKVGFEVETKAKARLFGLPIETVIGRAGEEIHEPRGGIPQATSAES